MVWTDFVHAGANSGKPKVILILGWVCSKMAVATYLVYEILKSAIS